MFSLIILSIILSASCHKYIQLCDAVTECILSMIWFFGQFQYLAYDCWSKRL